MSHYGSMPTGSVNVQVIPKTASVILVPYELPSRVINSGSDIGLPILYRASLNFTNSSVNITAIHSMFLRMLSVIGGASVILELQHSTGVIGFQNTGKFTE